MLFRHFFMHCLSYVDAFFGGDFWLVRWVVSFVMALLAILVFPIVLLLGYRNMVAEEKSHSKAGEWSAIAADIFLSPLWPGRKNR